jgi:hypothetical protein
MKPVFTFFKTAATLLLFLFIQSGIFAQVSQIPQNKNFLIERGTGLACGSCPTITEYSDTIINDYHPGRGFLIEYHTGPDARPQAGGINDFQTIYGDSIEHTLGFYLNMAVNRRDQSQGNYNNYTFIYPPNVPLPNSPIGLEATALVNTPSPLNLWMISSYDPQTRRITALVEVYYTANSATTHNEINIALTEDSLFGMQYTGVWNPNFNHMNLFRDQITPMWGDTIKTTTQGTYISRTYTYTVPATYGIPNYTTTCNPLHCNLTLYVTEDKNTSGTWNQKPAGKVITAIRTPVGNAPLAIAENKNTERARVYPNPSNGIVYIDRSDNGKFTLEVTDILGNQVYRSTLEGTRSNIDMSAYESGVYFIKVNSANGVSSHKVLLAK